VLTRVLLPFLLFLGARPITFAQTGAPLASGVPEKPDVRAIVEQAVANFRQRESMPRDYTYLETVKAADPRLKHGHSVDLYEIIEIKGHAFRRHLEHDGVAIARPEKADDADHEKWLEVQHKILEEEIKPNQTRESMEAAVRKIMEDAGLKDWHAQLISTEHLPSMGVVNFTQTLYQFKLPIEALDQKFDLKLKDQKALNGRATYVIQADPKHTTDKNDAAANFRIKVWIDQKEMQIVKIAGEAIRTGPLATPEYSAFSAKNISQKELDIQKQQLAASRLCYGDGTTIVQEWTKVNDEVWLLRRRHVKGSHVFFLNQTSLPAYSSDVEYDIEDTNHRKFRVQHRFLSFVRDGQGAALEQR
jgi:hypothetical protein